MLVVSFEYLESPRDVAVAIGCSADLIVQTIALNELGGLRSESLPDGNGAYVLDVIDPEQEPYARLALRKKNPNAKGQRRLVWAVRYPELANAHKSLGRRLEHYLNDRGHQPHDGVHGFVRGRSTLTNASCHLNAREIVNGDIEDFFSTVTTLRVRTALIAAGLNELGAGVVASFLTIGGVLPLGLCTSPLLANLVCGPLDARFSTLANELGCAYTRYADDFTFSGARVPSRQVIEDVLQLEGFRPAQRKFRTSKRGQRHFVTGLSVSETDKPRLPKRLKRRLRQEIYYCQRFGIDSHLESERSGINRLDGQLAYARGIEPGFAAKLVGTWRETCRRDGFNVIYPPRYERAPYKVTMLVDESIAKTPTGKLFALCCVTLEDAPHVRERMSELRNRLLKDPHTTGRKARLPTCFHFAEDTEEVKTALAVLVAELPIRGFIAYGKFDDASDYKAIYKAQFADLLHHRFRTADRREVEVVIEENDQVERHVQLWAHTVYCSLACQGARRPVETPRVTVASKAAEELLALPDHLLGVFKDYALSHRDDPTSSRRMRYERLRDRIRMIHDRDLGLIFSRSKPFGPWVGE